MVIFSINMLIIYISLPLLVLQYALALFCLSKLAYLKLATKHYVFWNIIIMLAFYIGGIVFLIIFRKDIAKIPKKITINVAETVNENTDSSTINIESSNNSEEIFSEETISDAEKK